jgi:hypothetical protein
MQGCSRLYRWEELHEPAVLRDIKNKVFVKGRIPRMQDFDSTLRKDWSEGCVMPCVVSRLKMIRSLTDVACTKTTPKTNSLRPIIERAQNAILSNMPALAPLLPIKMSVHQVSPSLLASIPFSPSPN